MEDHAVVHFGELIGSMHDANDAGLERPSQNSAQVMATMDPRRCSMHRVTDCCDPDQRQKRLDLIVGIVSKSILQTSHREGLVKNNYFKYCKSSKERMSDAPGAVKLMQLTRKQLIIFASIVVYDDHQLGSVEKVQRTQRTMLKFFCTRKSQHSAGIIRLEKFKTFLKEPTVASDLRQHPELGLAHHASHELSFRR